MNADLLESALQKASNPQLLINILSQRSRQLYMGHRPMVQVIERQGSVDIAAREYLDDQLEVELPEFESIDV